MSPLSVLTFFFALLLGAHAKWIFAIQFERYAGNTCQHPKLGHHAFVKEDDCHSWPAQQSFQSYRHYWVPHLKIDLNNIKKYGDCEIRFWAEDGCTGQYMGQLQHANSYSTLAECSAGQPGEYFRSIMVVCDKSKRPD